MFSTAVWKPQKHRASGDVTSVAKIDAEVLVDDAI